MSYTHTNTNIEADTIWENEDFSKNTYLSKYLYIYHSSHHSYIKRTECGGRKLGHEWSFVPFTWCVYCHWTKRVKILPYGRRGKKSTFCLKVLKKNVCKTTSNQINTFYFACFFPSVVFFIFIYLFIYFFFWGGGGRGGRLRECDAKKTLSKKIYMYPCDYRPNETLRFAVHSLTDEHISILRFPSIL